MGDCRAMSGNKWNSKMDLGFPLPEDHLPEGRVCVQFEIPDDQTYAADVIGHIMQLGKWWNWEKGGGGDRRATETAQLFRKAIHETLCVEKYRPMGCNCPDSETYLHRVTEDGGLEVSTDGGVTWTPDPTDPRLTAPQLPKLPGDDGNEKRCEAATNIRAHVQEKSDQIGADAELWSSISFMIGALIGLLLFLEVIGTGGALTPVVLAFGGALLAGGRAAFLAAMTEDVFDQFQCMLYCEMKPDGTLKAGGMERIKARVSSELTGIATTFLINTINLMGEIGLNNMAKTGSGMTAECDDCECPETCNIDFWQAAFWNAGTYYPPGSPSAEGIEIARDDHSITIQSVDRGDGQQVISLTTAGGTLCCGFSAEFIGEEPAHVLHFFNGCDAHANYATLVPDNTAPFSNAFTMAFLQMDPGSWVVKFTIAE